MPLGTMTFKAGEAVTNYVFLFESYSYSYFLSKSFIKSKLCLELWSLFFRLLPGWLMLQVWLNPTIGKSIWKPTNLRISWFPTQSI